VNAQLDNLRFRPCAPMSCPACGEVWTQVTNPGDAELTICLHCAAICVLDNTTVRKMEEADYARMPLEHREQVDKMRRKAWLWLARNR
jgi:hypothetical protein